MPPKQSNPTPLNDISQRIALRASDPPREVDLSDDPRTQPSGRRKPFADKERDVLEFLRGPTGRRLAEESGGLGRKRADWEDGGQVDDGKWFLPRPGVYTDGKELLVKGSEERSRAGQRKGEEPVDPDQEDKVAHDTENGLVKNQGLLARESRAGIV